MGWWAPATPHTGLEQIADVVLLGQLEQLVPVGRHQLLVGGHHALARPQGPLGKLLGGLVGSGVAEVLATNGAHIDQKVDDFIRLKYILDPRWLEYPG